MAVCDEVLHAGRGTDLLRFAFQRGHGAEGAIPDAASMTEENGRAAARFPFWDETVVGKQVFGLGYKAGCDFMGPALACVSGSE